MKNLKILVGIFLILLLCGCQFEHYNFEDINKYFKEKYPNANYKINKEFIEEEYDRMGNTRRDYEVKNNENGQKCYVSSIEFYTEHVSYEIYDNCEEIFK